MTKRSTANTLLVIAALLFAARYLAAAIFGSGMVGWSAEIFNALLQYVGSGLHTAALVALVAGVAYLIWAELAERRAA